LQLALGNHLAFNLGAIGIMQAQAQIAFVQQQASDDVAGRLAEQGAGRVRQASAQSRNALGQQLLGQGGVQMIRKGGAWYCLRLLARRWTGSSAS
jgi:hypothetical protein